MCVTLWACYQTGNLFFSGNSKKLYSPGNGIYLCNGSLDEVKRNPGEEFTKHQFCFPDSTSLHPGYKVGKLIIQLGVVCYRFFKYV